MNIIIQPDNLLNVRDEKLFSFSRDVRNNSFDSRKFPLGLIKWNVKEMTEDRDNHELVMGGSESSLKRRRREIMQIREES